LHLLLIFYGVSLGVGHAQDSVILVFLLRLRVGNNGFCFRWDSRRDPAMQTVRLVGLREGV